jgi:hypothetical protein
MRAPGAGLASVVTEDRQPESPGDTKTEHDSIEKLHVALPAAARRRSLRANPDAVERCRLNPK